MKKYILTLSGIIMLMSCEKNNGKQSYAENRKPDTLAIADYQKNEIEHRENTDYCYMNVLAKDTLMLKYTVTNGNVSGKMMYKNFEKDSSSGDVSGKISGDTLKLNYKFTSEGMSSEREVYFLHDSGVLLEGIGAYSDNNAPQQKYSSAKAINYSKGRRLAPADCNIFK